MRRKKINNVFLIIFIIVSTAYINTDIGCAISVPYATGKINSSDGVNVRESASTKSDISFGLNNNASIYITKIVFTTKKNTKSTKKWYFISSGGRTGYVRSDLIDNIKYYSASGKTTASLNYRVGAGTSMAKKGALKKGKKVTIALAAKAYGSSAKWYCIKMGSKVCYAKANYIKLSKTTSNNGSSKCDAAKALLKSPTNGGKVRVVYKFTSSNCKKRFSVKGDTAGGGGKVPQGMAFDSSNYYILFAMDSTKQCIVRYAKDGTRKELIPFDRNLGHLNGMTWDDTNKLLLITKGNQYDIYTYNPATEEFGTASTKPHSNSGVGYDTKLKNLAFSSKSSINTYDADGEYTYQSCLTKCKRSGTYYVQDCAAYNGFIFHCISTGSKTGDQNYIDIYRSIDSSYLGTIQFAMGEVESAIIRNGYLEILCNTPSVPDYIWKTNLKVTDLE